MLPAAPIPSHASNSRSGSLMSRRVLEAVASRRAQRLRRASGRPATVVDGRRRPGNRAPRLPPAQHLSCEGKFVPPGRRPPIHRGSPRRVGCPQASCRHPGWSRSSPVLLRRTPWVRRRRLPLRRPRVRRPTRHRPPRRSHRSCDLRRRPMSRSRRAVRLLHQRPCSPPLHRNPTTRRRVRSRRTSPPSPPRHRSRPRSNRRRRLSTDQ